MSRATLVAAAKRMGTYSLSGSGIQLLTAGTTALHVSITTLSPFGGIGNANPANHYHQALLRPGDGTGFWVPVPIEGGPQWLGLPNGTDRIGYACEGGAVISVVEVIGGTSPFAGPPGSAGPAGPAGASGASLIQSVVLTGTTASLDLAAIPNTFTHLDVWWQARSDQGAAQIAALRLNGDSGANYDYSGTTFNVSSFNTPNQTTGRVGAIPGSGAAAGVASVGRLWIPFYAGTTWWKVILAHCLRADSQVGEPTVTYWHSTAAINELTLLGGAGNLVAGSRMDVYGVT